MTEALKTPARPVGRATVELEGGTVPVREGVYGERVVALEPGGIEYISESERHGRPLGLFWMWASPNLEFATVYVGVLPIVLFGGGFWPTAVALLLERPSGPSSRACSP
jgi:hypothetical protein